MASRNLLFLLLLSACGEGDSAFLDLEVVAQVGHPDVPSSLVGGLTFDETRAAGCTGYGSGGVGSTTVWDLTNDLAPRWSIENDCMNLVMRDNALWTAGIDVKRFDTSQAPTGPNLVHGGLDASNLVFVGDLLVVADQGGLLHLVSVTGDTLTELSTWRVQDGDVTAFLPVDETLLWVSYDNDGTYLLDLSDPAAVQLLVRVDNLGASDILMDGDWMWTAVGEARAWDVSDPLEPVFAARVEDVSGCMARQDPWLFACDDEGFAVFDLSDIDLPVRVRLLPGLGGQKATLVGDRVVFGGGYAPLTMVGPLDP